MSARGVSVLPVGSSGPQLRKGSPTQFPSSTLSSGSDSDGAGVNGASVTRGGGHSQDPALCHRETCLSSKLLRPEPGELSSMVTHQPDSKQHAPHVVRTADDSGPRSPSKNFLTRSQTENFNLFKATFKWPSPDYKQVNPAQSPGLTAVRRGSVHIY